MAAIGDLMQKLFDLKKELNAAIENNKNLSDKYEFILDCNSLWDEIQNQIFTIYNSIRDSYGLKFPELESLVPHPVEYARVVKKIGNKTDISSVDFEGLLFPAIIVAVSITSSTTNGTQLPDDVLQKTMESCDHVIALEATKNQVLDLLTTQMGYIAPNLSAVVGISVAAKLVAAAGGLSQLANMASCNVQRLGGRSHNNLAGFSRARFGGGGYLEETLIFQSVPPSFRIRACRLLANKSIIAARVDFARTDRMGNEGKIIKDAIREKISKWLERPPPKQPKPLPVPVVFQTRKHRGGRRSRKRKERYGLTEVRKLANMVAFGVAEEIYYAN